MGFDLSFYFRVIRRCLWLIIIVSALAGIATNLILSQLEDVYETRALINVGSYLYSPNPDFNDVRIGQELTQTYAYLAGTDSIQKATAIQLDNVVSASEIGESVSTGVILNTSLFEVIVTYHNPIIVADIANAISDQLVIQSPSNLTPQLQTQVDLSQSQINLLNIQIEDLQAQSEVINTRLAEAEADDDRVAVEDLSRQRSNVIQQINQATATIASFTDTITQIEQRVNSISIQERAAVPSTPITRNTKLLTAIAILGTSTFMGGSDPHIGT